MTSKADLLTVAALELGITATFNPRDLAIQAWSLWPDRFGVAGYREHADTHAVMVLLSSGNGPVKRGQIERVAPDRYRLTELGCRVASAKYAALKAVPA